MACSEPCPTFINVLVAEWANPLRHTPKSNGKLNFQKSGGHCKSKEELNLEWDVQKAHMRASIMVRCTITFGNIVYMQ